MPIWSVITSTKNMLDLESMDRTVPREAPENAILDKVDLKVWIQWKGSPQQIDWVKKVILRTFLEVEPKQIRPHSKLIRRTQGKLSLKNGKELEWEVPGKVTPPPRPSKTRAPIRALARKGNVEKVVFYKRKPTNGWCWQVLDWVECRPHWWGRPPRKPIFLRFVFSSTNILNLTTI